MTVGLTCLYVANPACDPAAPADAIVVLGAAVWPGERPSPALARRIERGIELWQAGLAPILAPTGGVGQYPPSEAEVMADVARASGVPDDALMLETQATSTAESAERIRDLAT
ncbi:MAG: YdcF family protein, partial [Chloroflexota bacterium]